MVADLDDLEKLDASDIDPRRINAKEILIRLKDDESYSHLQMVQQNCREETTNSENPLQGVNKQ